MSGVLEIMYTTIRVVAMFIGLCLIASCYRFTYSLNQDRAEASMRAIRSAEATFLATNHRYGSLGDLGSAKLIDEELARGTNYGYRFKVVVENTSYRATAVPVKYGWNEGGTGSWSFYLDESGVIRGNVKEGAEAHTQDPPLRHQ